MKKQKNLRVREEDRVCVYVWRVRTNIGDTLGHASLQTFGDKGIYVSWWPREPVSLPYKATHPKEPYPNRTYEMDVRAEGRPPDETHTFYSLDKNKIFEKFEKEKDAKWQIFGKTLLTFKAGEKFHTCSSMVAVLLDAGGGVCENFVWDCILKGGFLKLGVIDPGQIGTECSYKSDKEKAKYDIEILPSANPVDSDPKNCSEPPSKKLRYTSSP